MTSQELDDHFKRTRELLRRLLAEYINIDEIVNRLIML